MRLDLVGGSYSARWVGANCQRCINYYPEPNAPSGAVPVTHYQRPGFRLRTRDNLNVNPVRCLYRASNGNGYAVIGSQVYSISPFWILTSLGSITALRTNPCSMIDNGTEILVVDGSLSTPLAGGWTIDMTTNAFAQVNDPTGIFEGADKVDTLDGFILWNKPGTRQFGSTLNNIITPFDPLYIASKSAYPDLLNNFTVNRNEIVLLGTLKGEIFYDVGGVQFPFARLPGTSLEHGLVAKYSVANSDISTFWLGQDLQGQGIIFRLRGYETKVISNYAIAWALQLMYESGTISDAIGYCYQQGQHVFYVLNFPSANQTWVYDDSVGDPNLAWSQRAWTDALGNLNRDRSNCFAYINGRPTVGDWENGCIYTLDNSVFVDAVGGDEFPISYIRTFPHLLAGVRPNGEPHYADGRLMEYSEFVLDLEVGESVAGSQVGLRWSVDKGKTFQQTSLQTAGEPGLYMTQPKWAPIGSGRDVVFEIVHNIKGPAAINCAWVQAKVLGQ